MRATDRALKAEGSILGDSLTQQLAEDSRWNLNKIHAVLSNTIVLAFSLAQEFRECVKTRVRTRSGSDGILRIPRNLMIRSLPILDVLLQTCVLLNQLFLTIAWEAYGQFYLVARALAAQH